MSDLDQILSGETQEPEAPEPEQTPEPEQPEEPEQKAEAPDEPEQPEEKPEEKAEESPTVPLPVFTSTRDDLKAQLRAATEKLSQYEQQRQQPQRPEAPDVLEDQQGFVSSINQRVSEATLSAKLDVSETMARESYGDELVDEALQAAKASGFQPDIYKERHPWGSLVKWHQGQKAIQEIGDPTTYKERVEKEIRAKIEAEMAAKQAGEMASKAPPSMANVNGSGGQRDPGWQGPTDLNKLIGD
jgi:hypothetical protein